MHGSPALLITRPKFLLMLYNLQHMIVFCCWKERCVPGTLWVWIASILTLWASADKGAFADERKSTISPAVTSVAFSSDGRMLAAGFADGTIRLWRMGDGDVQCTIPGGPQRGLQDFAFFALSPDGSMLAKLSESGDVELWDVSEGKHSLLSIVSHAWQPIRLISMRACAPPRPPLGRLGPS